MCLLYVCVNLRLSTIKLKLNTQRQSDLKSFKVLYSVTAHLAPNPPSLQFSHSSPYSRHLLNPVTPRYHKARFIYVTSIPWSQKFLLTAPFLLRNLTYAYHVRTLDCRGWLNCCEIHYRRKISLILFKSVLEDLYLLYFAFKLGNSTSNWEMHFYHHLARNEMRSIFPSR